MWSQDRIVVIGVIYIAVFYEYLKTNKQSNINYNGIHLSKCVIGGNYKYYDLIYIH